MKTFRTYRQRLIVLWIATALLLVSCDADFLKKSALETTGGSGAGLSGYQTTPTSEP